MGLLMPSNAANSGNNTKAALPDHPGRKKIVHPVLLVTVLAQMSRELGPVPDAVQQRMNKDLAPAGGDSPAERVGKVCVPSQSESLAAMAKLRMDFVSADHYGSRSQSVRA